MSSPVRDDLDKRFMYAPPWARETPRQPPQAIVAAIERLRQERLRVAAPASHDAVAADIPQSRHREDSDRRDLPLSDRANAADIEAAMAEAVRDAWTPPSLDPVTMPEPPRSRLDGPTWGMFMRLGGAVGFAAAVALFVTGALPLPSIDVSFGPNEAAKVASSVVHALGMRESREPKPAAVPVADAAPAVAALPVSTPAASVPSSSAPPAATPVEVRAAFASLETPAVEATPVSPGPKIDSPLVPAAAPAPTPPEHRALDPDELASLLKRGQALLAEGDISSARLLLRRAAEAGDAAAALLLAGTYDRVELAKLRVIGVVHDDAQAKIWYTAAVALGSAEAVRRLQHLAERVE